MYKKFEIVSILWENLNMTARSSRIAVLNKLILICRIYYLFFRYQWIESCLFFIIYFSKTWATSKYKFCLARVFLLKIVTNIIRIAISTSKVTVYCQHRGGVTLALVLSCGYDCLFSSEVSRVWLFVNLKRDHVT